MNLYYSWWCDRAQYASRLRRRFETWIVDALARLPNLDSPDDVKADAMSYLDRVTLAYSGIDLGECTGGFLRNGDEDDLPFDFPANEPEAPFAGYLEVGFPQFVAAVTAFYGVMRISSDEARIQAAARFVETLGIPLQRAIKKTIEKKDPRGDQGGCGAVDEQALTALLSSQRLHRGVATNTFDSFANALAYVTASAMSQTIDVVRKRREFTTPPKQQGTRERTGDDDGFPEIAVEPDQPRLLGAGRLSNDFGEWPELFQALSAVASCVADAFPATDGPRELLQLMLGGVYHKAQNSSPWSELPWGVQPLRIRAVVAQQGPNWLRSLSSQIDRLMHDYGYLGAVITTLVAWVANAETASVDEELPDTASLAAMHELVDRVQQHGIDELLKEKDTGWTCYENVTRQTTRQILDDLVVPNPPAEFTAEAAVAAADVENWLARTDRPSPPRLEELAWAAQTLWQAGQNHKPNPATSQSGQGTIS